MTAQLEFETYQYLVSYLSGRISLREFRTWFDANTWDQSEWESLLVGQIELTLAELSSCNLSEKEFKEVLTASLPTVTLELRPISASESSSVVTSSASSATRPISAFVLATQPAPDVFMTTGLVATTSILG